MFLQKSENPRNKKMFFQFLQFNWKKLRKKINFQTI